MKLLGLSSEKATELGFNINQDKYTEGHNRHDCDLNMEIFYHTDLSTIHSVNAYGTMIKFSPSLGMFTYNLYAIVDKKLVFIDFPKTYEELFNYLKLNKQLFVAKIYPDKKNICFKIEE